MKLHILLVDDDKDELSFFLDALKDVPCDDGFKCTYANNPQQAIEMLKYLVPDFIFFDYNMPETNGLELLLSIKNQLGLEKPKVYLYSIFTTERIKRAAMNIGASGAIKKMNTIRALRDELASVLPPAAIPA